MYLYGRRTSRMVNLVAFTMVALCYSPIICTPKWFPLSEAFVFSYFSVWNNQTSQQYFWFRQMSHKELEAILRNSNYTDEKWWREQNWRQGDKKLNDRLERCAWLPFCRHGVMKGCTGTHTQTEIYETLWGWDTHVFICLCACVHACVHACVCVSGCVIPKTCGPFSLNPERKTLTIMSLMLLSIISVKRAPRKKRKKYTAMMPREMCWAPLWPVTQACESITHPFSTFSPLIWSIAVI